MVLEADLGDQDLSTGNWVPLSESPGNNRVAPDTLRLTVVLKKTDEQLREIEQAWYRASTPGSRHYGRHLSTSDIARMVEGLETELVVDFFTAAHPKVKVHIGSTQDLLSLEIPVEAASNLFQTKIVAYHHAVHTDRVILRAPGPYSLPKNIADHVLLVANLRHFPSLETMHVSTADDSDVSTGSEYDKERSSGLDSWPDDCGKCSSGLFGKRVTPDVLTQAYALGARPNGTARGTIAVAEFTQVFWDQDDLTLFGEDCGLGNITVDHYVGPANQPKQCKVSIIIRPNLCKEALLDIETIKGLSGTIKLTNFYTADYDLLGWAKQLGDLADGDLPLVHSVSYGNDEAQQTSTAYMLAVNTELQKLGARGASILFASGDDGVYGRDGSSRRYHPGFPATSPYVVTVGGTDFTTKNVIGSETAWWGSGGGFSDTFAIPSFQVDAVNAYKKAAGSSLPDQSKWNASGAGFPDVAALAGNKNQYCITLNNGATGAYGTSAATPVLAVVVAKLNELRLAASKPPVGALTPLLYQRAQSAFNDITTGQNGGRPGIKSGFPATKGWDPATGLGTPDFAKLAQIVMSESLFVDG